jgi:hypothetical protein
MKFWKIETPNHRIIYTTTVEECTAAELYESLKLLLKEESTATCRIKELTREEFDKATIIW